MSRATGPIAPESTNFNVGMAPGAGAGLAGSDRDVAARLGTHGDVLRLRRLRLSGGRPLIVQTSYLPAALAHIVESADLGRLGLYTLLAEHGLTIARAQESISPTTIGTHDARDLARPQGSPALLSHQISFTAAGHPLIDDHALLPADAAVITVNRSAERLEVHYTLTS